MYCATLSLMTSQPAITTRMVMKLLSRMKRTEMPSTPSKYSTLNRGIQDRCSTNCIPACVTSKPTYKGSVTANPAMAAISAAQRARLCALPAANTTKAPRIGTQMA